jgi:hypothetical protein
MGMPLKTYARLIGCDPKAVRRAVAAGFVVRDADGLIDPQQAAAWASTRQASRLGQHQNGEAGAHAAAAKIAAAAAKLRLAKHRFDEEKGRFVDRVDALRVGAYEAEYFLAALAAAPAAHAERFIAQLDVPPAVGREILARYTERILTEVGDLRAEALRAAESL